VKLAALGAMLVLGAHAATYRVYSAGGPWSPDGKHVVLIAHVKGPGGWNHLEITRSGGGAPRTVYWSNDSCCSGPMQWVSPHRIVFVDDYRTKTLDPSTGRVRTFAELSDVAVSPNGKLVAGWDESGGHDPEQIDLVAISGRKVRTIPKPANVDETHPSFSPDGRRIVFDHALFTADQIGPRSLWIADVAGGPGRPLGVAGQAPRWSPDGRWIAFQTPQGGVAIVSPSGGHVRILFRSGVTLTVYPFSWSPDSRHLVFLDGSLGDRLGTVDLQGHRRLFDLGRVTAAGELPYWSPDSRRILFTGRAPTSTGTRDDAYTIGVDGRGLHRLT
jgi:Tol biopolymer transport system component